MTVTCRTCLQINKNGIHIFDYQENGKFVSDMLIDFASIEVQENDGLPFQICNSCLNKLTSAWKFRVMVIEADLKLRGFSNKTLTENVVQTNNSFVKEESSIANESDISTLLKPEIVNIHNISRSDSLLESQSTVHNFLDDKSEQVNSDTMLVESNVVEGDADTSKHMPTCRNKVMVSEICVNNFTKNGEPSTHNSEIDNKIQIPYDLKQGSSISNVHCDKTLENRIISRNDIWNENTIINTVQATQTQAVDAIQHTNNLIIPENEDILLKHSNSDEDIDNCDVSTENIAVEFISKEVTKKLTKTEKNNMSVFCETCNRSFGYRYYFEIHVKHHNGDKQCKCNVCGKTFVRQFQLRLHMAVHSDERPFACETCGKTFKFHSALISHKSLHSDDSQHICSICQKIFKTKNLLRLHLMRHKNEKKFICELCGKSCSDASIFSKHKLTHVCGKKFDCPTCGKTFTHSLQLRSHLKVHSEERPHVCSSCGKSFKTKSMLRRHSVIHTNKTPYSCLVCSKLFKHSASLYNHMRIHTEETPYPCQLCPSKFKYSHNLKNHMKSHK